MRVFHTIQEVRQFIQQVKLQHQSVGFIPTMGYLHDGHLTLAKQARKENDVVVMSIFVNPTQFGPNEDFDAYPRDLPRDTALAETVGVDAIFAPSVEEMYPTSTPIKMVVGRQAEILCGASRPGHFDGVLQVVSKLFHIVQPDTAYFGQKDAQQVAIIQTMVRDYNFPVTIRVVDIVREENGLAKSSRNVFLSDQEKKEACAIYQALQLAKDEIVKTNNVSAAIAKGKQYIIEQLDGKIDYFEALSYPDLQPINDSTEQILLAAAVYVGKPRLIDNILFDVKEYSYA